MQAPKLVRLFAAGLLAAVSMWPATVIAQKARATSLGVGGGFTMPTGDYSDCCSSGFNVGGFVQWRQPDQVFGVRGEVLYNRNDMKDEWINDLGGDSGNTGILSFDVDGVLEVAPRESSMGWYLLAGVGMYQVKTSVSVFGSSASDTQSELGFNAGGGLTFRMGGANLFVEGRWHNVKVDNATYAFLPLTVGLRW